MKSVKHINTISWIGKPLLLEGLISLSTELLHYINISK